MLSTYGNNKRMDSGHHRDRDQQLAGLRRMSSASNQMRLSAFFPRRLERMHHLHDRISQENELTDLLPFSSLEYIPHADETPRKALVVENPDEKFLRLNIGGMPFTFKIETLVFRNNGALTLFAKHGHEQRLLFADAYFSSSKEYYFERSSNLFHVVYQYYTTGKIHQAPHVCAQDLLDEFHFWHIDPQALATSCDCMNEEASESSESELSEPEEEPSPFKHVRLGRLREKIWNVMEEPSSSASAQVFTFLSVLFVLISISGLVLGSIPDLQVSVPRNMTDAQQNSSQATGRPVEMEPHPLLVQLENVCIVWFLFEYVTKMVVTANRRQTFCQLLNIIDLLAILPFLADIGLYLAGIDTEQLRDLKGALLVIRILRVLRVIRVLKLGRYSSGLQMFGKTLKASFRQLGMMAMVVLTGVIFFSTLVYFLEKDEPNTQFHSIPAACWFSIVTMTTVGYGDLTPVTVAGKLVATGAIACGVLVLALPITIIVDNFMKVAETERRPGFSEGKRGRRNGPKGKAATNEEEPPVYGPFRAPPRETSKTKPPNNNQYTAQA